MVNSDQWQANSARGRIGLGLVVLAIVGLLLTPASAAWAERDRSEISKGYDPAGAGHPVKIAYFILYPVGFLLDTLILHPAWWLGQRQPFRTVFGVDVSDAEL